MADDLLSTLYLAFKGPGGGRAGDECGNVDEAGGATQRGPTVGRRRERDRSRGRAG